MQPLPPHSPTALLKVLLFLLFAGGDQNNRQDSAEPGEPPEVVPGSPDHEDPGPPQHCQAVPGDRDGEDPLLGDGVRVRRRGLRLPRPSRQDEGERSQGQVPTGQYLQLLPG